MLNASYRYFHAIAQERSIRKAADLVHISASAMSRQIALLEQELGQPLLERRSRGVVLTQAGLLLSDHIRRLMLLEQDLRADIAALDGLKQGRLRIAMGNGFAASVALLLGKFANNYPGLTYSLSMGDNDSILRAVVDEEADIGIVFSPPNHDAVEVLCTIAAPLALIAPKGHPLTRARRKAVFEDLQAESLALLRPSHRIRQILQKAEARRAIKLRPVLESNSYELIKIFVRNKPAITVLPMISVLGEIADGKLSALVFDDALLNATVIAVVVRRGKRLPVAASTLLAALQEEWRPIFND